MPSVALKRLTVPLLINTLARTTCVNTFGYVTESRVLAVVIPSLGVAQHFTLDHKTTSTAAKLVAMSDSSEAIHLVFQEPPQA